MALAYMLGSIQITFIYFLSPHNNQEIDTISVSVI